ncbi:MAG TPA: hypothetical protein VNM39_15235, partial [Verrucomicrobiae bacterium]|nr:hypothetical protein [Verrucomicrobiae bacterium]
DVQWVDDDVKATITAMGDLIVGLSAGTYTALHTAGSLAMGPSWSERILVTDSSTSPAGVKWGPLVTVGNVAPTSPRPGDIWMDTT